MQDNDLQYRYDLLKEMDEKGLRWAISTNAAAPYPVPEALFLVALNERRAMKFATSFWTCLLGGLGLVGFGLVLIANEQGFPAAPIIAAVPLVAYAIWARAQATNLTGEAEKLKRIMGIR